MLRRNIRSASSLRSLRQPSSHLERIHIPSISTLRPRKGHARAIVWGVERHATRADAEVPRVEVAHVLQLPISSAPDLEGLRAEFTLCELGAFGVEGAEAKGGGAAGGDAGGGGDRGEEGFGVEGVVGAERERPWRVRWGRSNSKNSRF